MPFFVVDVENGMIMAFRRGESIDVDIYDPKSDKWRDDVRLEVVMATHDVMENGGSVYVTKSWRWQLSARPKGWVYEIRGGEGGGDEGENASFKMYNVFFSVSVDYDIWTFR